MNIPLVDLKREYLLLKKEIDNAIEEVLQSGRFILGKNVKNFEKEFASYIGKKYGIGVNSGTDALRIALNALGVKRGDEVITVSFSFISTADSILHNQALPVFVDVDEETYNIDLNEVKKVVNDKTKVIIPVHIYGNPVRMDELMEIANDNNVYVVEDCCQAHGAEYKNKKVGSFGIISCFSFYPSKNLGAYGDGGIILTDEKEIAEKIRMLREYGQKEKYSHEVLGYNSRLDEIQAAVLRVKLKYLDEFNKRRRKIAQIYKELLEKLDDIKFQLEEKDGKHVYHIFSIQSSYREELRKFLNKYGISTGIHYPIPIHLQKYYSRFYRKLPVTEKLASRVLSLPMFPFLKEEEIKFICNKINQFYKLRN